MTQMQSNTQRYEHARHTLAEHSQDHVLSFFNELDPDQQKGLLSQIESIDWPEVSRLIETHVKRQPEFKLPAHIEPAPCYPYQPGPEHTMRYGQARAKGEDLVRQGKVAAFTVAGGQGTRLGWDAPKGTFPATPIREAPLFQVFAEFIHKTNAKYDTVVPWYIMTSPANDAPTREFFEHHEYFGLDPDHVHFFPQAMMPAIDMRNHRVLMEDKDRLALSPNGHGGSLKALHDSGALEDMRQRGIEQISYTQVDNPNVKMIDPLFVGLHALDEAEMSSKMVPKADPLERVGNFCLADGKLTVIEYSDLPEELARQTLDDGSLRFRAGSIAIHVMRRTFVEQINSGEGFGLPFHRAEKKVSYLDMDSGEHVDPDQPNAVKLETFVFDALPLCARSIICETDRVEEFAPIKNADAPGATDSPHTSKLLQSQRAARWLNQQGVEVPCNEQEQPEATIEIRHTTAVEPKDLQDMNLPDSIERNARVLL